MKMPQHRKGIVNKLLQSVWLFPAILIIIFLVLVVNKINGSSVGVYHNALYGAASKDKNLLYGTPKTIRSDEWLGWTQNTITQEQSDYPVFNKKLGGANDVIKNDEIPVNSWENIFRPNNWSFFFLPFEYAFAFKWWFLMLILILSAYFFILKMLPGQKLVAALLSLSFTISPFVLWWYQSALFLALAYGFITLILAIRIIDKEKIPKLKSPLLTTAVYTTALAYVGASLALTLYPPYALPVFIGVTAFLLGYIINKKNRGHISYRELLKRLIPFLVALGLVIIVIVIFISLHQESIRATAESLYPGKRRVSSGDLPLLAVLDGFVMPLLQGASKGLHYYNNQSEASNFILLLPFLIIPGIVMQVIEYAKHKKIDWVLTAVQLCGLLFLVRALVPIDSFIYHILLLDRVPNIRLRSGMGFVGLLQLVLIIKKYPELKLARASKYVLGGLFGLVSFIVVLITGLYIKHHFPIFLNSYWLLFVLAFGFSLIIALFLSGQKRLGVIVLLLFSVGSSFKILPLYHGLGIIEHNKVIKDIQAISRPSDSWITTDDLYYINFPRMAGRVQIGGSQSYPDPKLWSQVGGKKYEKVYNRQARVVFTTAPTEEKLKLIQVNYYQVKYECGSFLYKNVDYVLASKPIESDCSELVDTVVYPKEDFYIYKINPS